VSPRQTITPAVQVSDAIGTRNGDKEKHEMASFSAPARVELKSEKADGEAEERETVGILVRVTDSEGHVVTPWNGKVRVAVELSAEKVTEGGVVEANVKVANGALEAIPTPVAIIGIPGGLEVRHDQLKELVKAGLVTGSVDGIKSCYCINWKVQRD
jgi:hypothetical protein